MLSFYRGSSLIAQAAEAAKPSPSMFDTLLPFIFIFGVFYFLLIRPQAKKAKEHDKLLESLKSGDEIITSGGIIGRVRSINAQFASIEIAQGTVVKVLRSNISGLTKSKQEVVQTSKNPKKAKVIS